jgi:hypothetical protein
VLSCHDRIILTCTLLGACYAKGMTGFLSARQIRISDYPRFAEPLRDRVGERATELATAAGITIEHITKNHIRKEDVVVARSLSFVATVPAWCISSRRWKPATQTSPGMTSTRIAPSRGGILANACIYYFYFIDAELGLIYMRVADLVPVPSAVLLQ